MEKNFILNRRTVLGGAAALGTVGVLAACGSSKDSKATTQGATVGTDAKELYDLGEAAVSELKDGGTLRLAIPGIGGLYVVRDCHLVRRCEPQNVALSTEMLQETGKTTLTRYNLSHHSRYE